MTKQWLDMGLRQEHYPNLEWGIKVPSKARIGMANASMSGSKQFKGPHVHKFGLKPR